MPLTAAQADARLTEYMNAEATVLAGQSYSMGDVTFTRANLQQIREGIEYWSRKFDDLSRKESGGGIKVFGATPV